MNKSDIGVIALIYGVCLLFLVMTLKFPPAAQTYPLCLICGLGVLNTLYLANGIRKTIQKGGLHHDLHEVFEGFLPRQFGAVVLGCVLYVVGTYILGFYATTVLYLALMLWYLKISVKAIILTVAVMAAVIFLVFTMFLKVPLPAGLLLS